MHKGKLRKINNNKRGETLEQEKTFKLWKKKIYDHINYGFKKKSGILCAENISRIRLNSRDDESASHIEQWKLGRLSYKFLCFGKYHMLFPYFFSLIFPLSKLSKRLHLCNQTYTNEIIIIFFFGIWYVVYVFCASNQVIHKLKYMKRQTFCGCLSNLTV